MSFLKKIATTVAGPVVGGIFSAFGQAQANRTNRAEAQRNRDFQERMRDTAVQARAKDMEAAGINRILAGKFDASSPAGSLAAPAGNIGTSAVEGAKRGSETGLAMALANEQLKQMRQQTMLLGDQANKARVEADYIQSQDALTQQKSRNAALEEIGLTTANEIARLDKQIRALSIPGVKSEADFYKWLNSASAAEAAKAAGKAGPLALMFIRAISRK